MTVALAIIFFQRLASTTFQGIFILTSQQLSLDGRVLGYVHTQHVLFTEVKIAATELVGVVAISAQS